MHTWQSTQTEGWWRQAFDNAQVPFNYISTQDVAKDANLNAKYDVIIFGPGGAAPAGDRRRHADVAATRCRGRTRRTRRTSAPRIRPTTCARASAGSGSRTCRTSCARAACCSRRWTRRTSRSSSGLTPGLSVAPRAAHALVGSVLRTKIVDDDEPDRVRLHRQPRDLQRRTVRSSTCRTSRRAAAAASRPAMAAIGRPDAAPRTIPTWCRAAPASKRPREPQRRSPGRRRRSPTSSCATAQHHPAGAAPARVLRYADSATCSCRACSTAAATSRSTPRSSTCRSRKGTSCLLEQPDLARRDARQLLPRVQHDPELRPAERGTEAGRKIGARRRGSEAGARGLFVSPSGWCQRQIFVRSPYVASARWSRGPGVPCCRSANRRRTGAGARRFPA